MSRTYPFLGYGISWPVRVDRATGNLEMASGKLDDLSVSIAYLADRWTIREPFGVESNLIADAVANIILTAKLEHDTLPEYGSSVHELLFEPNALGTYDAATYYFSSATKRWEHRVKIDETNGVSWKASGRDVDEGTANLKLHPQFIKEQTSENLVFPYVNEQETRQAEYPKGSMPSGNPYDWVSRYKKYEAYSDIDGIDAIRLRVADFVAPSRDDEFYEVKPLDTWMLIAHKTLADNRLWWVIYGSYLWDQANAGSTRDVLNTRVAPTAGDIIRTPSKSRVLLGIVE